eukprot:9472547-Pyramimonas_sp.AAC.1
MMNLISEINQRQQRQDGIVTSMLQWIHHQATTNVPNQMQPAAASVGFTAAAAGPQTGDGGVTEPLTPMGKATSGGVSTPAG